MSAVVRELRPAVEDPVVVHVGVLERHGLRLVELPVRVERPGVRAATESGRPAIRVPIKPAALEDAAVAVLNGRGVVHHDAAGNDLAGGERQKKVLLALDDRAAGDPCLAFATPAARPRLAVDGRDRGGLQDAGVAADLDVAEHPRPSADLCVTRDHGLRPHHNRGLLDAGVVLHARAVEYHGIGADVGGGRNACAVGHESAAVGMGSTPRVILQELDASDEVVVHVVLLQPPVAFPFLARVNLVLQRLGRGLDAGQHGHELLPGESAVLLRQRDGHFLFHGVVQVRVSVVAPAVELVEVDNVALPAVREAGPAPGQGHLPRIARGMDAGQVQVPIVDARPARLGGRKRARAGGHGEPQVRVRSFQREAHLALVPQRAVARPPVPVHGQPLGGFGWDVESMCNAGQHTAHPGELQMFDGNFPF
ncbi:MAG: hypothetical protein ACYTFI_28540, partial [Planctomycetota bacterium]